MIKGIGDSLNVLRQGQTLAAGNAGPVLPSQGAPKRQPAISRHRLASYGRWARTAREQHGISASQVALQALQQADTLLGQLKAQLQTALSATHGAAQEDSLTQAEQLRGQLTRIRPEYQGRALLDHQLNLLSPSRAAAPHVFCFKSVDLTSPKQRDENILIQLGKQSLQLLLPAGKDRQALNATLAPALASLGLSIDSSSGEAIFKALGPAWARLQEGVLMMGEGQRLPAGELRNIRLEERYGWQDPREWQLQPGAELKQSLAKIIKTRQKVTTQIQEILASHAVLLAKAQASTASAQPQLDLQQLHKFMQPQPFAYQMTSLMAQGNTNRDQVTALLG
ncbi:hypothetical protein [Shewanella salipaludis]|uniref:Uncharacterized protein n=1 Tax=Shewanella salipaludis TaxID=2723052 RepID=A0A972JKZ7_9GAMM|nr:hypothetical protein [Shewanella salipaludis]NMH66725.1 hypothetical protein [Shewanella salipaludis]